MVTHRLRMYNTYQWRIVQQNRTFQCEESEKERAREREVGWTESIAVHFKAQIILLFGNWIWLLYVSAFCGAYNQHFHMVISHTNVDIWAHIMSDLHPTIPCEYCWLCKLKMYIQLCGRKRRAIRTRVFEMKWKKKTDARKKRKKKKQMTSIKMNGLYHFCVCCQNLHITLATIVTQCKCQHCRHHRCHRFHFYRTFHSVSAFPEIFAGHRDNTYETRARFRSRKYAAIRRKTIRNHCRKIRRSNEWTTLNTIIRKYASERCLVFCPQCLPR